MADLSPRASRSRRARVDPWVGPWLRSVRRARNRGLAPRNRIDLADAAERLGLTVSTLSRIERGEVLFPADELPRILAGYRIAISEFGAAHRSRRRALVEARGAA